LITTVDLNPYFTNSNPNYAMDFSATDIKSIAVTNPDGSVTTLAGSSLGLNLTQNDNDYTLNGKISDTATPGSYNVTFYAHNAGGYANAGATLNIGVGNVPYKNSDPQPLTVSPGQNFAPLTISKFFTSPVPDISGPLTMPLPPDINYVQVIEPGSSQSVTLASSALGGSDGLTIASVSTGNYDLTGAIPATAPNGTYHINFTFSNNLGIATTFASLALTVQGTPPPPTPGSSISNTVGNGKAYALNNLASYFSYSSSIDNIRINRVVGPNGTTLPDTIGLTIINSDNQFNLTGTINLTGSEQAGVYRVEIGAHNAGGWSVNPFEVFLTIPNKPIYQSDPTPQTHFAGDTVTSINMNNSFSEQNNIGTMSFDPANIQVTGPSGNTTLAALGLSASGNNLSGTLPTNLTYGDYSIKFIAENEAGLADSYATFILHVLPNIPSAGNAITTPIEGNGSPVSGLESLETHFNSNAPLLDLRIDSVTDPQGNTTTLANLGLSLTGSGGQNRSIEGTLALGSAPAGQYIIKASAENGGGWSDPTKPLVINLIVAKLPVHQNGNPSSQNITTGNAITPVDMSHYFIEENNIGTMTFNENDFVITGPDNPTLNQLGLVINGNSLEGTLANTLSSGTYTIAFKARNEAGPAQDSATLTLQITKVTSLQCPAPEAVVEASGTNHLSASMTASDGTLYNFTGDYDVPGNPYQGGSNNQFWATQVNQGPNLKCLYTVTGGGYFILTPNPIPNGGNNLSFSHQGGEVCTTSPSGCQVQWTQNL